MGATKPGAQSPCYCFSSMGASAEVVNHTVCLVAGSHTLWDAAGRGCRGRCRAGCRAGFAHHGSHVSSALCRALPLGCVGSAPQCHMIPVFKRSQLLELPLQWLYFFRKERARRSNRPCFLIYRKRRLQKSINDTILGSIRVCCIRPCPHWERDTAVSLAQSVFVQ